MILTRARYNDSSNQIRIEYCNDLSWVLRDDFYEYYKYTSLATESYFVNENYCLEDAYDVEALKPS